MTTLTLLDLPPLAARTTIAEWVAVRGEAPFRVKQIVPRLWQRPVASWADATDLPRSLRAALEQAFPLPRLTPRAEQSARDGTRKYLWELADGQAIETVWIPEGRRRTLCVSSQVGCALGCVFCATGRMGFRRNLTPSEIALQARELVLRDPSLAPTNVVFMGMGEPLLNWPAVDVVLSILNAPVGMGIGARHITVSTVGIPAGLTSLASRPEQFRLAISLHAPTSERRRALMPIEKRYPLRTVIASLEAFRRRVTFEYVLISGSNDSPADAAALSALARQVGAMVNILPLHPGGAPGLAGVSPAGTESFAARLRESGVEVVVRRSRGLEIAAACGQLRVELERRRKVRPEQHGDVEEQGGVAIDQHPAEP